MSAVLPPTDEELKTRWDQVQETFEAALKLAPPDLQAWLTQRNLPADVVAEVQDMLAAHSGPALEMEQGLLEDQLPESLGAYQVLERIGQGGMGEVFLARRSDGSFERQVAIKTLRGWMSTPQVKARFDTERRLHARLEHPNITRLLDAGLTDQGLPYLVTDFVDGLPIGEYANTRRLTQRQRAELLLTVTETVAFAHSQLVLHRDLKPSNVLVTREGQPMLLDFGIAKMLDSNADDATETAQTRPGEQLMTLRYASPEQIRGEALDVTCDVYGLGVLLYELLYDQTPFNADSQWALSELIVRESPLPGEVGPLGDAVDADLWAIAAKCLEKDPKQRYRGAAALAADLRRYLNYQTISARRPGLLVRAGRIFKRAPLASALSSLAVVAVLTGALAAVWQAQQAQRERDEARAQRDRAEQVTQVLVDLFDSDPYAEADRRRDDVTLREFLVRRAGDLGTELEGQPLLRAQLLDLLAGLLANLSLLEDAELLAQEALALRQDAAPLQRADSLSTLGNIRVLQGRYREAEDLLRQSLEMRQAELPENHPDVISSLNDLSVSVHQQPGDAKEAESMALDEKVLALNIQRYGEDSLQAAQSYNNLGVLLVERGQAEDQQQAALLLEQALNIRRQALGPEHINTATTALNLANLLHDLGQLEQASTLFTEAVASTRLAMGDSHTRVADAMYGYGFLLMELENWSEAVAQYSQALSIYRGALPVGHPFITDCQFALGQAQLQAGELAAAASHFSQAAERYRQDPADLDSELSALHYLVRAHQALQHNDQAAAVAERALERGGSQIDPDLKAQFERVLGSPSVVQP